MSDAGEPAPAFDPPYYAVIFSNQRTDDDPEGYETWAVRMLERASRQPGYLGVESTRGQDGFGITVSYWESLDAIDAWRRDSEHCTAKSRGRADWYAAYGIRIAKVERAWTFRK